MLEVPDYSKIFDKYYDVLKDKIIRYAKKYETLKERRARGELDHPESSVINLDNVSHNIGEILPDKYSAAEDFFCSELSDSNEFWIFSLLPIWHVGFMESETIFSKLLIFDMKYCFFSPLFFKKIFKKQEQVNNKIIM